MLPSTSSGVPRGTATKASSRVSSITDGDAISSMRRASPRGAAGSCGGAPTDGPPPLPLPELVEPLLPLPPRPWPRCPLPISTICFTKIRNLHF